MYLHRAGPDFPSWFYSGRDRQYVSTGSEREREVFSHWAAWHGLTKFSRNRHSGVTTCDYWSETQWIHRDPQGSGGAAKQACSPSIISQKPYPTRPYHYCSKPSFGSRIPASDHIKPA
jgi:hypothetical protein